MNQYVQILFAFGCITEGYEYNNIYNLLNNAVANQFTFFDEETKKYIDPYSFVKKIFDTLISKFPVFLFAKKNGYPFKIKIEYDPQKNSAIIFYPLDPVKKKKGFDCGEETINLGFYIECALELCENFAIHELSTHE